jgi:hypothetical protein
VAVVVLALELAERRRPSPLLVVPPLPLLRLLTMRGVPLCKVVIVLMWRQRWR